MSEDVRDSLIPYDEIVQEALRAVTTTNTATALSAAAAAARRAEAEAARQTTWRPDLSVVPPLDWEHKLL